ncbi:hypothetical protein [Flavobacterium microcysteis]|uniref:DUF1735 domain-containing protein n=1 Tax=Flavobacterium microcysteis TaxID=2596891 RepID=A0A501Q0A6_9FLAO|nr:hypothetical protein [Flavobacterium microcysteis]TPD65764.1 hypothetical protein FJA49_16390 [Flavobacterium microcysteis]
MKKLFILLISVASFISCSDPDEVTYDSKKTFVGFENTVYDLRVPRDASTVLNLKFASSSVSSAVRTYNVSVITDVSDANTATYSIPATFTIPANERFGTLAIAGTDNGLVDATVKKFVFKLSGLGANETTDNDIITVFVYEFCPVVAADFAGTFDSNTWFLDGPAVNEIVAGTDPNTIVITDFYDTPFVLTYDEDNNITFPPKDTGLTNGPGGPAIWARMSASPTQVSGIDGCTGRMTLWIEYYTLTGLTAGVQQEVFVKQ